MATPVNPNPPPNPASSQPPAGGQDSAKGYSPQGSSGMNDTWFKKWFPGASEQDCKAFMTNMMRALQTTMQQDARMAHRAYLHMKHVIEGQG